IAMQDQVNATPAPKRVPWNKGKLTGAKPPLRPKHVWSIRTTLQIESRARAMFNLAIDSKHAFDGVRRPQVIPMLGREVEEGQQCFAILGQAVDRLVVFGLVFLGEDIDCYLGQSAARCQVDFAQ